MLFTESWGPVAPLATLPLKHLVVRCELPTHNFDRDLGYQSGYTSTGRCDTTTHPGSKGQNKLLHRQRTANVSSIYVTTGIWGFQFYSIRQDLSKICRIF